LRPISDDITIKISSENGLILAEQTMTVKMDGWVRFNFGKSLQVEPGRKLTLRLEGTGRRSFAWNYSPDGYPYGELIADNVVGNYDFLFRVNSMQSVPPSKSEMIAERDSAHDRPLADPFQPIDFDEACSAAHEAGKVVMIDFCTEWCGYCKQLDQITWKDPEVKEWLWDHTVSIKVDADKNSELVGRYRLDGFPTMVFVNTSGKEIFRVVGYKNPTDFLSEVENYFRK